MRILYVMAGYYGGSTAVEGRIQKFARGLRELGEDARVVALRGPSSLRRGGPWHLDAFGIPYLLVCRPFSGRADAWRSFLRDGRLLSGTVARVIESEGIDAAILYGNSWHLMGPIAHLCRQRGVPCLVDLHEWYPLRLTLHPAFWDQQILVRRMLSCVAGVVGISRLWEEHARRRGVPVVRIPAIGQAEAPPPPPPRQAPPGPFTLTYVGPLGTRDMPGTLLKGVRMAAEGGLDVRLVVVGDMRRHTSGKAAVRAAAADQVLRDRATFTGFVSDEELARRLGETDATVLLRPQTREAMACFPTRLPDYLLTGRPAILSAAGDVPLYFRHRQNAWLLPPGDRPEGLAEAMRHLAADPAGAAAIGRAGWQTALAEFSYRRHAPRLLEFLRSLGR